MHQSDGAQRVLLNTDEAICVRRQACWASHNARLSVCVFNVWFFLCAVSLATAQASRGSETERDGAGEELGGKTTTRKPDPESKGADSSFPHITRSARE